jgi:uncharacterized membrane protein YeaQ/YmgE (transglycosylase-associated protein family)
MAGLLAAKLFHHTAGALAKLVLDLSLGIAGAVAGGLAMNSIGFPPPTAFFVAGLVGAVAGSAAILAGYRAIFRPV